jgi:hypothetical protein
VIFGQAFSSTMSTDPSLDIYQTINQGSKNSKAATDVVVDNLGDVIGRTQAETVYAARAKGRPMILHNPQKESRTRVKRKATIDRQKDDKLRRKGNLQSERRMPKAATQGLK